ncbi:MAG: 7-cyano-7-deazaguanine reductase [Chloroflexi bacterium]|jgi:7-cyano-7-deazaguanine reductase|nr:MAG: 7-cyano-7-deazaguanine reductase [Chloroflexota bacterium]
MITDRYSDKRYDVEDYSSIDTDILEHIPFEYAGSASDITYETSEFTSVCPWTGLPDFGKLVIRYRPSNRLVELKSLKYYLTSFRSVGILQEHAVNQVLNDLVALLKPESMTIEAFFNDRGGLSTQVKASYHNS